MKDFNYYAPTEVVFGEQSEEQVAHLIKKYGGTKVLVHYGGKSAERSGLLDKICDLLSKDGLAFVKLGGVVPNPRLSLAKKGIELCRHEGVDFILAVGGGSVIDSAKCIGYGVARNLLPKYHHLAFGLPFQVDITKRFHQSCQY